MIHFLKGTASKDIANQRMLIFKMVVFYGNLKHTYLLSCILPGLDKKFIIKKGVELDNNHHSNKYCSLCQQIHLKALILNRGQVAVLFSTRNELSIE